jgi:hypothetical protein
MQLPLNPEPPGAAQLLSMKNNSSGMPGGGTPPGQAGYDPPLNKAENLRCSSLTLQFSDLTQTLQE